MKEAPPAKRKQASSKPPAKPATNGHPRPSGKPPVNFQQAFDADDVDQAREGAEGVDREPPVERDLPISNIVAHPKNPRKFFAEAALQQLADSIAKHGVLQRITVRRSPDLMGPDANKYQLLAGERRWLAAQRAGLVLIPCRIIDVSEADALEIMCIENLDREDLNPIERAHAYKTLLEDCGHTQAELAERLKCTQGQISNTIRLTELPDKWQEFIVEGKLPIGHARLVVPWAGYPKVLKDLETAVNEGAPSLQGFEEALYDAIFGASESMKPGFWDSPKFKPTPEQLEALDVQHVPDGNGKPYPRAMNADLWKQLQSAAIEKQKANESAKLERASKAPKRELTAAERKDKARKAKEQHNKRLYRYKVCWLQAKVVAGVAHASERQILWLMLHFTGEGNCHDRRRDLDQLLKKSKAASPWWTLGSDQLRDISRKALALWLAHSIEGSTDVPAAVIEGIAADLGVDIEATWQCDEEFLHLHTKDQLLALAEEWSVDTSTLGTTRSQIIASLLAGEEARRNGAHGSTMCPGRLSCPKELLTAKPCEIRW